MVEAVPYYVHESWKDGHFTATIHRGDCIHCNYGRGDDVGSYLRRGKWHGPFRNRGRASSKLASLPSVTVRVSCECVQ